jgi:CRISPR-associated protein Cmr2
MRYLLSVSIGPVQEFIAAARRTRDLWFGSRLLSDLSKSAASFVAARGDLIFPFSANISDLLDDSPFTVVNKILASVDTADMAALVRDLRTHVRERLSREWKLAEARAARKKVEFVPGAAAQLSAFPEVYAVWTPLSKDDYRACRERVEGLAAGRKALRDFAPHQGTAGMPKSSLDGGRENVILRRGKADYDIRENEFLDAIGVLKRFGGESEQMEKFDSTLDVAGVPYARRLQKHQTLFDRYLRAVEEELHRYTWTQLYSHESRQIYGNQPVAEESRFGELRREIWRKIGEPAPPYYALLVGDGDGMGKAISGMLRIEDHQSFSERLSAFAATTKEMVWEHDGCPVYMGGDDVMALLPLHTAIECACKINAAFREAMKPCRFSAGMAVAHALDPLSEVREIAHRAERMAKEDGGSDNRGDALAVIVSPRSGAEVAAAGKWDRFGATLAGVVDRYEKEALTQGFAYELRDLAGRTPREIDDVLGPMARRAAGRKECGDAAEDLLKDVDSRKQLEDLIGTMLVARPFARARREANG